MNKKLKIKKGDQVIMTTGRDKGKKGEVLKVLRDEDRVLVQGINVVKKHQAASQTSPGGIIEKEASVHISNIALIDPKSGDATRIGYRTEDGRKVRFARKSGEVVDV
ncbi:50S ribosomal protein L24 [Kiloniella antarctica]|uniref:Large ribosomal subunit protein uL24 n=1 Tax=Kiloniella antarctica TaxID=1550907 RepID=A0ABW5BGG0_9PROT